MSITSKIIDHPIAFLLGLLLFALVMSSIVGCETLPVPTDPAEIAEQAQILEGKVDTALGDLELLRTQIKPVGDALIPFLPPDVGGALVAIGTLWAGATARKKVPQLAKKAIESADVTNSG